MMISVTATVATNAEVLDRIAFSQIGYANEAPKLAVVADAGPAEFRVVSSLGKVLYQGSLGAAQEWNADTTASRIADWSSVRESGDHSLEIPAYGVRVIVHVERAPWLDLSKALLKAYYFQRASIELEAKFAGAYARKAGHLDDHVLVHASAATKERPENTVISAPKGWYDAGDYNKYIVNSGISVWTLLSIYEDYPQFAKSLSLNIPESGQALPDLLSEVKWNLDWMLDMQDSNDGGVYHKLTNLRFDGMVMPDQCSNSRYVVMKTTAASLDFAAVMAQAARVYAPFDAAYAKRCLDAALKAFAWGKQHPQIPYRQPEDVRTGRYEDEHLDDEMQWAAFELFITTKDKAYADMAKSVSTVEYGVPVWQGVGTLGVISLALRYNDSWARTQLLTIAKDLLKRQKQNAFHISMNASDFVWGSNGMAANQGTVLLAAYKLTNDVNYRDAAVHMLDYLLGRNPVHTSYITGFGARAPMHPHHRPSQADTVVAPVPGLVVGGPNPGRQDQKNCPMYPSNAPALAYLDNNCSYATNEIAINWNAPAAYLAAGLQAIFTSGN